MVCWGRIIAGVTDSKSLEARTAMGRPVGRSLEHTPLLLKGRFRTALLGGLEHGGRGAGYLLKFSEVEGAGGNIDANPYPKLAPTPTPALAYQGPKATWHSVNSKADRWRFSTGVMRAACC